MSKWGKQKQVGKSGGKCQQYLWEEIRCNREYTNRLYRQKGKGRLTGVETKKNIPSEDGEGYGMDDLVSQDDGYMVGWIQGR